MNRLNIASPFASSVMRLTLLCLIALMASDVRAQQRVRFPNPQNIFPGPYPGAVANPVPGTVVPGVTAPGIVSPGVTPPAAIPGATNLPPVSTTPWTPVPGGAVLGQQIQPFDPYGLPGQSGSIVTGPAAPSATFPPAGAVPVFPGVPPASTAPALPPGLPPPPLNGPIGPAVPVQVAPLFPNGFNTGVGTETLFQDTGMLYTYVYGEPSKNGDELQMHNVEVFTSAVLKSFLNSPYSLRLTPGFEFHFLNGPAVPGKIDLPAQLYSAYLNALWQPQLTPQFGADLAFRTGVYSDFNTVTWHSIRFMGRGLGILQLTPTMSFGLGVEYLDRADIKLLPAGGLFWTPNPETQFDIYFPRPRLSKYWTTWGNNEIWWHIGAEYGGGSWTIDRLSAPNAGGSERIDINNITVSVGVDWNRLDRVDGIFEVGYVFEREIFVKSEPTESLDLEDTFLIRTGVKF